MHGIGALGYVLICTVTGWAALWFVPLRLYWGEALAAAAAVGIAVTTWVCFVAVLALGWTAGLAAAGGLVLVLWILAWLWKGKGALRLEAFECGGGAWLARVLVWGLCAVTGTLLYRHSLMPGPDGWYSGGYSWGDLALHMSLIAHFVQAPRLDMHFSLFPTTNLTYSFIVDFASAIGLKLGSGWQLSLVAVSGSLLASCIQLSLSLARRLTRSLSAACLHTLLFLGMGSFAGSWYFFADLAAGKPWDSLIKAYDYAAYAGRDANLSVNNIVNSHLLPQRGYAFGLAVAFLAILMAKAQSALPRPSKRLAAAIGGLVGLMPLVHVHSFFVSVGLLAVLLGYGAARRQSMEAAAWGMSLGLALAVALPQLYWQFHYGYSNGFAHPQPGWMHGSQPVAVFWLRNVGILAPMIFLAPWLTWKLSKDRFLTILTGLGLALFVVTNLFSFQPNTWDNMKFMNYSFWLAELALAYGLAAWMAAAKGRRRAALASGVTAVLAVAIIAPGALAIMHDYKSEYLFVSADDIAFARDAKRLIPANALVAVTERHTHPLPTLVGRDILVGYGGWLWSYGLPYLPVAEVNQRILQGDPDSLALMRRYGVTHVAFSLDEVLEGKASLEFYSRNCQRLYHANGWFVYSCL